jgi:hypothetical protein
VIRAHHLAALTFLAGCCAPSSSRAWRSPDARTYGLLREALASERAERPVRPWAASVRVTMREPHSGRVLDGRGAIAVAPGRAVRMILVGPAGATVFDAWVEARRWRVAIPPLSLVRRGGPEDPGDLPIGFFRWWFLEPLRGTLFAAESLGPEHLWLLHDRGAVIELRAGTCARGERLEATRRVAARIEHIAECGSPHWAGEGDTAEYDDASLGLRVDVVAESAERTSPDPDAFTDPDVYGGGS